MITKPFPYWRDSPVLNGECVISNEVSAAKYSAHICLGRSNVASSTSVITTWSPAWPFLSAIDKVHAVYEPAALAPPIGTL